MLTDFLSISHLRTSTVNPAWVDACRSTCVIYDWVLCASICACVPVGCCGLLSAFRWSSGLGSSADRTALTRAQIGAPVGRTHPLLCKGLATVDGTVFLSSTSMSVE